MTHYTYNANGTVATVTAPNGAVTTYSNFACSGLFPQNVSDGGVITSAAAWNCTGGVPSSTTDANGHATTYTYGGPGNTWLLASSTDPAGDTTTHMLLLSVLTRVFAPSEYSAHAVGGAIPRAASIARAAVTRWPRRAQAKLCWWPRVGSRALRHAQ